MAIPNCNDGSNRPPRLRFDLNIGSITALPDFSTYPHRANPQSAESYAYLREHGIEAVNNGEPAVCRQAGLRCTAGVRFDAPQEVDGKVAALKADGFDCVAVHVGTGLETDAEMDRYAEAILAAAGHHAFPIYVETHRATVTQDMFRTVQWIGRFPELRFNGDFSHYYTGHEMTYGDWEKKLQFLQPLFDRVRFVHGRIGNSGCMQVHIEGSEKHVQHFRQLWTRSFAGFLKSARKGDYLCFAPELLPANINYARVFPAPDGVLREEGDRWQQSLLYWQIARECFAQAQRLVES